jgi:pimeloyl-ACP methyl ester carboxylesterase
MTGVEDVRGRLAEEKEEEFREAPWGIAIARVMGWLLAVPYVLTVLLVVTGPPTWSSVAYLVGIGILIFGLITLPSKIGLKKTIVAKRPRGVCRVALGVLVLIMGARMSSGSDGVCVSGEVGSTSSHASANTRMISRLVDESDIARSGMRVLFTTGKMRDDGDELPAAMTKAYAEMRKEEGDHPSPVVATYLGMQHPGAFDVITYDPNRSPEMNGARIEEALIFLHGFAGNFTLPCWQIAKAVAPLNVLTVCPSTNWVGEWSTEEGEATLRRVITDLHGRGMKRIILAGLSNGGIGASYLAPKLGNQISGLILISGAAPDAKKAGVPTLVIHGKKDSMVEFGAARQYVDHTGAQLVVLDAGHFSMLVRAAENDAAIRKFVRGLRPSNQALFGL